MIFSTEYRLIQLLIGDPGEYSMRVGLGLYRSKWYGFHVKKQFGGKRPKLTVFT
jgi:hypothetical protein